MQCSYCQVVSINGMVCHEIGCPAPKCVICKIQLNDETWFSKFLCKKCAEKEGEE